MKFQFQFVLLAALGFGWALPALGQNECGLNATAVRGTNGTDSSGVNHQNMCVDDLTGKIFYPSGIQSVTSVTISSVLTAGAFNRTIFQDQQAGADFCAQAKTSAALLGAAGGIIDATGYSAGSTQSCAAVPFATINNNASYGIVWKTGPYTISYDPNLGFFDLPPNFHWQMNGTTVSDSNPLNASASMLQDPLADIRTFIGSRLYKTTGSITSGTATLTLASTTGLQAGTLVGIWGGGAANPNQQTTLNGAIASTSSTSFTVVSTTGWDLARASDQLLLQIDTEYLICTGGTATTFTGCSRGVFGTTAATHLNGANVTFQPVFLARVLSLAGSVATLDRNVSPGSGTNLSSATVWYGSVNVSLEGNGTITCNQPQTGLDNNLAGFIGFMATKLTIGQGMKFTSCEHGGVVLFAAWDSTVQGQYSFMGKPPQGLGADVWEWSGASFNRLDTQGHFNGDIAIINDDRSTNTNPWSQWNIANVNYIGPVVNYTTGLYDEGGLNTTWYAGRIQANLANAKGIISSVSVNQWTTAPTPSGRHFYFGSIDATGQIGIQSFGYTGGNNIIEGGTITATTQVSGIPASGDTVIYTDSSNFRHLLMGTGGSFIIDAPAPIDTMLRFANSGTTESIIGNEGAAGHILNGSALNDLSIRGVGGRINFGTAGANIGLQVDASNNTKIANGPIAVGTAATFTGSTGACSTTGTQSGGSWAGRVTCTAATAASTLVIVPGSTAPNGWTCSAFDQTTRTNLLQQTATGTTSCTLTATSITQNDVIVFSAIAF